MAGYFNSHPRVGGDDYSEKLEVDVEISIHTPAWGVTRQQCRNHQHRQISIRTPAWGVTGDNSIVTYANAFQFAPPRGGVTAKIHKTVFNHLYIFAALCAFCSEITQQKAIIIRILKENTSIHCADLPENYARL